MGNSIVRSHELENGPRAGIPESGLREFQDTGVPAGSVDEPGCDGRAEHANRFLVTQQTHKTTARGDRGRSSCAPLPPLVARSPSPPFGRSPFRGRSKRLGRFRRRHASAGDPNALLDQRPNLFGLVQCRDDASLDDGRVIVEFRVPFGQEEGARQIAEHGFTMARRAAERSASFSVSHGGVFVSRNSVKGKCRRSLGRPIPTRRRPRIRPAGPVTRHAWR